VKNMKFSPPKTHRAKAITIGCLIEAFFAGLLALGGFGPCGPTTLAGGIGMFGHFPAILAIGGLESVLHQLLPSLPDILDSLGTPLMLVLQAAFWSLIASVFLSKSTKRKARFQVGGIYSAEKDDGGYHIVKLLVHAGHVCHVRLYKQTFAERPKSIDIASLTLGMLDDPDGYGIGHMPIRESGFLKWHPELITKAEVTDEELEGYRIWKESRGGVF
jgi:hypothetical protein